MKKSMRWFAFVLALLFALSPVSALQESMDAKYNHAHELLAEGKYEEASQAFEAINTYEDSSKLSMYAKALVAAESGDYEVALTSLAALGEYKDCPLQITYYSARQHESQGSADYWNQWILAAETYDGLGLFRDSRERAGNCRESVYNVGIQMREAGDWDGAVNVFSHLGVYSDTVTQILETYYLQAKYYCDAGKYSEAYKTYQRIVGYKDVDSLLSTDDHLLSAAREEKLTPYRKAGSIVTFGCYEQDNNLDNGPEAIEWIVLDVQDGKSLLLSRYGLDTKAYHANLSFKIKWEQCDLRDWLNNDFLKGAFTQEEQSAILLTEVDNSTRQGYSKWKTNGGNNTQDYIFLLSYAEANKYLGVTYEACDNEKSRAAASAYAKALGAWTNDIIRKADEEEVSSWWLRSPGSNSTSAAFIYFDGSLRSNGFHFNIMVVRPAFWLNLEADI